MVLFGVSLADAAQDTDFVGVAINLLEQLEELEPVEEEFEGEIVKEV